MLQIHKALETEKPLPEVTNPSASLSNGLKIHIPKEISVNELFRSLKRPDGSIDISIRNDLMVHFIPHVRGIAQKLSRTLPSNSRLDVDDLQSVGMSGLIDAIEAFDVTRGASFQTYSTTRIRGAMLDELRRTDLVTRTTREANAKIEEARDIVRMTKGHSPTVEEVAEQMDISTEKLIKISVEKQIIIERSLNFKRFDNEQGETLSVEDRVKDEKAPRPEARQEQEDLWVIACKGLTEQEASVVRLYFQEGLKMKEVGARLELSESRISQIYAKVIPMIQANFMEFEESAKEQSSRRNNAA